MSTTYLRQTVSVKAGAGNTATATLAPQVGQYWAPSLVRVATGINPKFVPGSTTAQATAILFHGPTANADSYSYVDDTFNGSGDASSVLSGTIVMYGEVISATWSNMAAGDTAILTVYGRSADTLPELQEVLSPVPGARFSGNTANLMPWLYLNQQIGNTGTWSVPPSVTLSATAGQQELVCIEFGAITSATAGNRWFGLRVAPASTGFPYYSIAANQAIPASSNLIGSFSSGATSFSVGPDGSNGYRSGGGFGEKVFLAPGAIVSLFEHGGTPATDTWQNVFMRTRVYQILTKAGST